MEKNGIIIAGTIIVDKLYKIRRYPNVGELTKITGLSRAVGGCVPNTAVDIKVINQYLKKMRRYMQNIWLKHKN